MLSALGPPKGGPRALSISFVLRQLDNRENFISILLEWMSCVILQ